MNYNSSKTYSENLEVIKEQSQTTIGAAKPKNVRKSYEDYLKEVPQLPPSRLSNKIKNDIYFCAYPRNYDFYKITTNLTRNDGDIFFNRNDNNIDVYCNKLQNLYPDDFSSIQNVKTNSPKTQKTNIPLDDSYKDKWYDNQGNVLVWTDKSKTNQEYQEPTVKNANLRVCGAPRGYTCDGWVEYNQMLKQLQSSYQKCKTSNKGKLILPASVKNMLPKQKIELYETGMSDENSIQNTCQSKFTSLNDFVKSIFYNYEFPHGIDYQNLMAYKELYGDINQTLNSQINQLNQQDNYDKEDNIYGLPTDTLDPSRENEKLKKQEIGKLQSDKNFLLQGLDLAYGFDDAESPENLSWYQNFYNENQLVIDIAGFIATEAALAALTRGYSLESTVARAPAIIGRQAFLESSKFIASQALKQKLRSAAKSVASSIIWFGGVVNGILLPEGEDEKKMFNWILAFFPLFKMFPGVNWMYKGIENSLRNGIRNSLLKKAEKYFVSGTQSEWVAFFSSLNKPEKMVMLNILKEKISNPESLSNLIKSVSAEATKNIASKKGFGKILSIIQNSAKGNLSLSENKMLEHAQKVFDAVGGAAGKQVASSVVKKYILDTVFLIAGSTGIKLVNQVNNMLKYDLDNQKLIALQNWVISHGISHGNGKLTNKEYTDEEKEKLKQMVEEEAKKNEDALNRIKSGKATAEDVDTINDMLVESGVKKEDLKNNKLKMSTEEFVKLINIKGGNEAFTEGNDPNFIFIIEEVSDTLKQK